MHALCLHAYFVISVKFVWRQLEPCVFYAYSFGCTHFLFLGGILKLKINRKVCVIGIIIGVIIAIFGALIFFEAIDFGIYNSGGLYKSGHAEFGADYYTYVVNNLAEISTYTYRTMRLLLKLLGAFLFSTGTFNTLFFAAIKGKKESNITKIEKEETLPEL